MLPSISVPIAHVNPSLLFTIHILFTNPRSFQLADGFMEHCFLAKPHLRARSDDEGIEGRVQEGGECSCSQGERVTKEEFEQ